MAQPNRLMQPLRTESLRPRPSAQAQFEPPCQVQDVSAGHENAPALAPLMAPLRSLPAARIPEPPEPPQPVQPTAEADEAIPPEDDLLEDLLQNFTDGISDEEPAADEPDAVPTEQMPLPVSVPLYEDEPRRPRRWPWIVLCVLILLAGTAVAVWKADLLKTILP